MTDLKNSFWFQDMLRGRIENGYNALLLIEGRAGIGKSYAGMALAEEMDPTFNIDRVVFSAEEYLNAMKGIQRGRWIQIDEPAQSEVLSTHSWWAETQRALSDCLESNRYLGVGTILATINRGLLDSLVRNYLLHFMVNMISRGRGTCYEIQHSAFDASERTPRLGQLWFSLPSKQLIDAYEVKRHGVMATRYLDRAKDIETGKLHRKSFTELVEEARLRKSELMDGSSILDAKIRVVLGVGWKRAEAIRRLLDSESKTAAI
jgi:hypothetical protein